MRHKQIPYRNGNLVVIYDARIIENHHKKNNLKKKIGYFCLTLFLLGASSLIWPVIKAKNFRQPPETTALIAKDISENQKQTDNFDLANWLNQRGIASIPDNNFSLIIPQININTKVIPSVNLADKNAVKEALKTGVVQAKGGAFPGQKGTTYIFGHSTDSLWNIKLYNAIFYSLKDVQSSRLPSGGEKDRRRRRSSIPCQPIGERKTNFSYLLAARDNMEKTSNNRYKDLTNPISYIMIVALLPAYSSCLQNNFY